MGQLLAVLLLAVMLQAPASSPATPGQAAPPESQRGTQTSQESPAPATSSATGTSQRGPGESIDEFVERTVNEAMSGLPSERDPELSPEAEQAIENAVEGFLNDPEIKTRIAEAIRQGPSVAEQGIRLALISTIGFFAVVALIALMLYRRSQGRIRARMEFHQQVLSKFNSGQEFAAFLNTKGSQQLLEGMLGDQVNLRARLLKHVRLGAIFGVIGLGLLGLAMFDDSDYGFLAVLSLGIGIGFLISARVSYRLSEKMGLLHDDNSSEPQNENNSVSES